MPSYLHPGVYVEEIASGSRPIEGVATSIAAFVGAANRGPVGVPTLIGKFDDYVKEFGQIVDEDDDMGLAVQAYYLNGGGGAYICRLASGATSSSTVSLNANVSPNTTVQAGVMSVTASSPGTWADTLYVRILNPVLLFDLEVGTNLGTFEVEESYYGLSMDSTRGDFVSTKVNGKSAFIRIDTVVESLEMTELTPTDLSDEDSDPTTSHTLTVNDGTEDVIIMTDITDGSVTLAARVFNLRFVFDLQVGTRNGDGIFSATEEFASVSMDASSENFAETIVNDLSSLVTVDILTGAASIQYPTTDTNGDILAGGAATDPTAPDFTALYEQTLRKFRDISIIVLPGSSWDGGIGQSNIAATLAHCESIRNRVLILDPPISTEFENATIVNGLSLPTSTYSVLYYPWVKMSNPLYHPDKAPDAEKTVLIPPSAIAAGMWAKIDGKRGVWKAPAGVETRLTGAAGLEYVVENLEQDQLNPLGVNCIRKLPSYGSVFWGSRSLATKADPEWRYVPVRRTAIYIEESIYNGIQWAVFEPNAHPLWSSLRANIGNFMNGLFRAGAFQGQTAKDSYFVRCGLGDTMTQGDIDAGQVIVMIGFAPLKPAEFVIVRIQQKVGEE